MMHFTTSTSTCPTELKSIFPFIITRRYSPLRKLTSSSCGGLWALAKAFFALLGKILAYENQVEDA